MGIKTYDFVVEGARVSGSLVSRLFAEEGGYKIAVCDPTFGKIPGDPPKLRTTKEKPCGGIVDHEVVEKFKIPETATYRGREYRVIDRKIGRYMFISPDRSVELEYLPKNSDVVVLRKFFDWYNFSPLLDLDKNIDFFPCPIQHVEETPEGFVNTLGNGKQIIGANEIGAGGVSSRVRKDIFWDVSNDHFCTVMVNFLHFSKEKVHEEFDDMAYFWFPPQLEYGYGFVIPGLNHVRVGVGQRGGKTTTGDVLSECYNELVNIPLFKDKLGNPEKIISMAHPTPFGKSINFYKNHPACGETQHSKIKRLANRKVLIGEAAFHNNYLTFEGIRPAMLDAELAWKCWRRDNSFESFDNEWSRYHGTEIVRPAYQIDDFYNKEKLAELFKLAKETNRPETLVLAFKGHVYVPEPGMVREKI